MVKNKLIILGAILSAMLLVSCSNKIDINTIPSKDNQASDNETNNNKNQIVINKNSEVTEILTDINESAKSGKVIDCNFAAKDSVIDDVINQWGKEESSKYIEDAKGTYYTFKDKDIVFGCNKGSQVFEVRTFSSKLKEITFKDMEKYYGTAPYCVVTDSNERIIGYEINSNYKILFVYKDTGDDAVLDHYSVLYPAGTVNMMADDPGRQW